MAKESTSTAGADRNLLFGILALQMNFVTREALIAGMNAWVLDKTRPLSEILVGQGQLPATRMVLLNSLVAEHLETHNDDPKRCLAAVTTSHPILPDLEAIADEDLQASLVSLTQGDPTDGEATLGWVRPGVGKEDGESRYRVLRPLARGGLGEVFVAEDQELYREVALKEILSSHAHNRVSRERFIREAEITGGLEHPGIVPVYGLGQYADGRPYYAMRFIRGDNFKQAIERFHEADVSGRDAGERSLAFRQLLRRFVDACNAIAYAHSRGVLHRDIKPVNLMLGKYGETLVVDWGLAKVGVKDSETNAREAIGEETLRPRLASDGSETQVGSALGTPAYMSPEQAAGRVETLGPASDIYSLGATLYTLLTGAPPVRGKEMGEILQQVQRGDIRHPRQVKADIAPALEAICLKAMALRPQDRYATALDLAEDVEHWLADEPVSAHAEPMRAQLSRWVRRHQPLVAGIGTVLVAAIGFLILIAVLVEDARQQSVAEQDRTEKQRLKAVQARQLAVDEQAKTEQQRHKAEQARKAALREKVAAEKERKKAITARDQAAANLKLANENLALALRAVNECYTLATEHQLLNRNNMQPVRKLLLEAALKYYQGFINQRRDDPKLEKELIFHYDRIARINKQIGSLPNALTAYQNAALLIKKRIDAVGGDPFKRGNPPIIPPIALEYALLGISYMEIAELQQKVGQPKEALLTSSKAVQIFEKLAAADPKLDEWQAQLARSYGLEGVVFWDNDQYPEALRSIRRSLAILEKRRQARPGDKQVLRQLSVAYSNISGVLARQGQLRQSFQFTLKAQTNWRELVSLKSADDSDRYGLALLNLNISNLQHSTSMGTPAQALQSLEEARNIIDRLHAAEPSVTRYSILWARIYVELYLTLVKLDRPEQARLLLRRARDLMQELVRHNPSAVEINSVLGQCFFLLGVDDMRHGESVRNPKRTAEHLERAVRYLGVAHQKNPRATEIRVRLSQSYALLGGMYIRLDRHADAAASARQVRKLFPKVPMELYSAVKLVSRCLSNIGKGKATLSAAEQKLKDQYGDEAIATLRQAIAAGFNDIASLKKDMDLDQLRKRPDFQKLLLEMEKKNSGGTKN